MLKDIKGKEYPDFTNAELGDECYSPIYGKGTIIEIDESGRRKLLVQYYSIAGSYQTKWIYDDGRDTELSSNPVFYKDVQTCREFLEQDFSLHEFLDNYDWDEYKIDYPSWCPY